MCNIQYISNLLVPILYISEYSLHLFTCFNIIIFEYLQKCHLYLNPNLGFKYLIIFEKLNTPHKI